MPKTPAKIAGQTSAYDEEVPAFSPPTAANQRLTCDLLVAGGGLSGLSAADAARRRGLDVIVIEKGEFGREAASGLNAGQFLTGWAKSVDVMLDDLTQQELRGGATEAQARDRAERRVRAFLRRTVEGCRRLAALDHDYNLRASVRHGAVIAAVNDADMADVCSAYRFMEKSNFRALMAPAGGRRPPFFEELDGKTLAQRYGTAEDLYVAGVIDHFGGSFRPRKLLLGLARALAKRGVRFFRETEAQALDFADGRMTVFCGNGAAIETRTLFMANAYARHINGDVLERVIFEYDYVVQVEVPDDAKVLSSGAVFSDSREPCFYARRHGKRLYMGFEETPETSAEITREVARRTLAEGKRIFPGLRGLGTREIRSAWSGRVFFTLDDYPFVERIHRGRVVSFAAPSDHGNSLALRVGELVGSAVASKTRSDGDQKLRRLAERQLKLFEQFPKGLRLRPGRRYQAASGALDEEAPSGA